jgi:hypothetical protein
LCELSAKRVGMHVVREGAFAVDLDDGQPLAKALLQLGSTADVNLLELEVLLRAQLREHRPRPLAEVALRRVVKGDARYGYG